MLSRKFILMIAIVLALTGMGFVRPVRGQVFDFEKDRMPMAKLDGLWRFHTGDDADGKLGWARPGFDDSAWPLLRSDEDWSNQGYKGYSGFAWYRFEVLLPPAHGPMALYLPTILTSYEVFADGQLIGGLGGLPPHELVLYGNKRLVLRLPAEVPGRPVTIAIRVWHWKYVAVFRGGGPRSAPRIGDADLIEDWKAHLLKDLYWEDSSVNVLLLIFMFASPVGFALFFTRRQDREYLWFGTWQLSALILGLVEDYADFHPYRRNTLDILQGSLQDVGVLLLLGFLYSMLKPRKDLVFWIAFACPVLMLALTIPLALSSISAAVMDSSVGLLVVPFAICLLIMIWRGVRRGVRDAGLLLFPIALTATASTLELLLEAVYTSGLPTSSADRYFGWVNQVSDWPFPFSIQDLASLLIELSILTILVLRFARSRADEERLKAELESARVVQGVLVPEDLPAVPGFSIDSVYKPAGQVGGDFFQILPIEGGGSLIVIGDVSGKGMPAAMTVSLLVGTVRTLVHYTQSPGAILTAMNQRMIGRSNGGFTTCLVLRADPDGRLTIANAGHISPYLEGKELAVENGLPLGLAADASYPEAVFVLPRDRQLTLVTDGVVEACGKSGELFGFERTAAIAGDSAESIALAALAFGQDDDITVLTLVRVG